MERDIVSSQRKKHNGNLAARSRVSANPFLALQREVNNLFDDFFSPAPFETKDWNMGFPQVDIKETDKELKISAELPGLTEKDIEVLISEDLLTIQGEKREEKEDKKENYYSSERYYGSFKRQIRLPEAVTADKVQAKFKNGVLDITIPKSEKAQKGKKKVEIKTSTS